MPDDDGNGMKADFFADRKSTRLNSSHSEISYAVFCLKKKKNRIHPSLSPNFFPGMIEIEQHNDAGLGIESRERDQSDPACYAHVVAEEGGRPGGPDP